MSNLANSLTERLRLLFATKNNFLAVFALITILSIATAIGTEYYIIAFTPFAILGAYLCYLDYKLIFYLLIACIPISVETQIGSSLVDFPTEFLIILLMGIYFIYVLIHWKTMDRSFITHPISLLLLVHLIWTIFATSQSDKLLVSVKFLMAKMWYITTFYFLAGTIFKDLKRVKPFFYALFVSLTFVIVQSIVRHASYGFSFKDVNKALEPFFRNHVNYACIIALTFPFLILARRWVLDSKWKTYLIYASILLFLLAIQLSYTRTAYATIAIAGIYYLVIRLRMTNVMIMACIVMLVSIVGFMTYRSNYLNFAPDYSKTITHKSFDNLMEATFQMKDISTMERVYRWIAGFRMVEAQPFTGFGPGNFYTFYKGYTVNDFKTYVSDNPEQSGIHCYYLMLAVEQGVMSTILFFVLVFYVLYKGEKIYFQLKDKEHRAILLAALSSYIIILGLLLINDMVETDKVGAFFFINMAIIINVDLTNRRMLITKEVETKL
jgi:O-antigen ligase